MYAGKFVFAQLTDLIHPEQFRRCVQRYNGDYKVKTFSCGTSFFAWPSVNSPFGNLCPICPKALKPCGCGIPSFVFYVPFVVKACAVSAAGGIPHQTQNPALMAKFRAWLETTRSSPAFSG